MLRLLAVTLLLTPVLTGIPAPAGAAGEPPSHRELRADRVLAQALEVVGLAPAGSGERAHATEVLTELAHSLPLLSAEKRRVARAVLARPSAAPSGDSDPDVATGGQWSADDRRRARVRCNDPRTGTARPYCLHWVPASTRYQSRQEVSAARVQATFDVMQRTWQVEVTNRGFRRPKSDGTRDNPSGNSRTGLVDVYLSDIGDNGFFGYAVPEQNTKASTGYMVLENDFTELVGWDTSTATASGLRKATAAHEFFHLVQFAYDSWEGTDSSAWLKESTAAWMEDQVFDDVNDSRTYLKYGPLAKPDLSLTTYGEMAHYGAWAFHQIWTSRHGGAAMRELWERCAEVQGDNWLPAFQAMLASRGSTPYLEFQRFGAAANAPGQFTAEGSFWPQATLTAGKTGPQQTVKSKHLAGANFSFTPSGTTATTTLRIDIQATSGTAGAAYALVFHDDGTVTKHPFTLDSSGFGSQTFGYGPDVTRVILNVFNPTLQDQGMLSAAGTKYTATVVG